MSWVFKVAISTQYASVEAGASISLGVPLIATSGGMVSPHMSFSVLALSPLPSSIVAPAVSAEAGEPAWGEGGWVNRSR